MPKPDVNKDYYGILELKADANVDEIKKAYHKLAFKWHPDRNHGREQEAATKFQDVSNAYEILIEPTTKAKYDNERAKSLRKNATPFTSPTGAYPPYGNFPQPRQAPTSMKSPPAKTGGAQYTQYATQTNAPWSNPNGPGRPKASPQDAWKAWDSMKAGGSGTAVRGYPPARGGARGGPTMPPRPKPTAFATTTGNAGPTPKTRAGWSEPEDQRSGPANAEGRPGPGLSRANTMRSPRRTGFDPLAGHGDEPPARNASAYYNVRGGTMRGARPQSFVHPNSPLPTQSPPPQSRPDQFKGFRTVSSDENVGGRLSTPYSTGGGEKTYFSSADLYRDPQPESASNLSTGWKEGDRHSPRGYHHNRHRSASPRMRSPRADESETSAESSSADEEPASTRTKLRAKGYRDRPQYVPPPPQSSERPAQPGLTVENEFGKVHEFSKPVKSSTWNIDASDPKTQAERLNEEYGSRRTSTGNISEHLHRSPPQPSPLYKTTTASSNNSFEPMEKTTSWQQQYGSPTDTMNQRRFEPPGSSGGQSNVSNSHDPADLANQAKNNGSYFESQTWQEKFGTNGQNPFVPQNLPRHASPVKAKGHSNLRLPRKNSAARKPSANRTSRTNSDADSVPSMSSSTESISSGNAMDIDTKTPPVAPTASAAQNVSHDRKLSSSTSDTNLNLKDLQNTAPFASTNSNGLDDLNDLGAQLPFDSKAASTLPCEGINTHKLRLPHPPKPPKPPNTAALDRQVWEYYLVFIRKYMAEWNLFNQRMLQHFTARQYAVENELPNGWLDGIGEGGLSKYMSWLEEDERVRAHWDVSFERHRKAMEEFQKVKKCASTSRFVH